MWNVEFDCESIEFRMVATRILITGGSGQLARDLAELLPRSSAPPREELDVTRLDQVRREVSSRGIELVFNCAAYNAVDRAEEAPTGARAVNAEGAGNVARACSESGAKLVHFSTNYVFAGGLDRPYVETDDPHPGTVYGRSKRDGEIQVLEELPSALVIRSSGLFGRGGSGIKGGSFPDRLIARARSGSELSVVDDQRLNPTFTGHLARAAIAAADAGLTGVLHLVAAGCCSYYEFALEILRLAGLNNLVNRTLTENAPGVANRPLNGCLYSTRTGPLPAWQDGIAEYLESNFTSVA